MSKKIFVLIPILAAVLVVAGCSYKIGDSENIQGDSAVQDNSDIIFFYGQECPHCQRVEEYFSQNNIAQKIEFSQREVYHDKANAAFMLEKAKACGISEQNLGVPFLWVDEQCYFGDTDIIKFFDQRVK